MTSVYSPEPKKQQRESYGVVPAPKATEIGVGIDIGMTYSGASIYFRSDHDTLRIEDVHLPNEWGRARFPSRVFVGSDGRVTTGANVLADLSADPRGRVFQLFKRDLGNKGSETVGATNVNGTFLTTQLITEVKRNLEAFLRHPQLRHAQKIHYTFTHPATWGADKRQAMNAAIRDAGFEQGSYSLLDEPTATALDTYGLARPTSNEFEKPGKMLIVDLGGGTLDFSVVARNPNGSIEMKAAADGDAMLGMSNIDKLLDLYMYRSAGSQRTQRIDDVVERKVVRGRNLDRAWAEMEGAPDVKALHLLKAEKIKIDIVRDWNDLTTPSWAVKYNETAPWVFIERPFMKAVFDEMNQWVAKALESYLTELQTKLNLERSAIDRVVLGGGGSNLPGLDHTIRQALGDVVIMRSTSGADLMVQRGAAKFALKPDMLREKRCYASFGVRTFEEVQPGQTAQTEAQLVRGVTYHAAYWKFLERNSIVPPYPIEFKFCPLIDDQPAVDFVILEGEETDPDKNKRHGTASLPLPPGTDHTYEVVCRFHLGPDGLIHASAHDLRHPENASNEITFQWDQDPLD